MWIGLDVGKEEHFADVVGNKGDPLFAKSIGNNEADLVALLDRTREHGTPRAGDRPARLDSPAGNQLDRIEQGADSFGEALYMGSSE